MSKYFGIKTRLQWKYFPPEDSIYSHRFFDDLCSGYSFNLGNKDDMDFYSFEPRNCRLEKLFNEKHYHQLSYDIEKTINQVIYSLLAYGKAYAYLKPEYSSNAHRSNNGDKVLTGLAIEEIKGCITKKNNSIVKICYFDYNREIVEKELKRGQLIEFDIKSLGFSKRYFRRKVRSLKKCEYLRTSTNFLSSNLAGYNFFVHSKKYKLKELIISKDIGWSFGIDGLSDSYILYKKIQCDKLKVKILEYILERLNNGFNAFVNDAGGQLIANIKEINYDQLWKDYSLGKLTSSDLTNILYHNR